MLENRIVTHGHEAIFDTIIIDLLNRIIIIRFTYYTIIRIKIKQELPTCTRTEKLQKKIFEIKFNFEVLKENCNKCQLL